MHVFTDTPPGGEPGRDDREPLIRAAMERAAEDAPPPPDLVPVALVRGRRRRARSRAAIGAGVAAVAALGVLGATLPMWGGGAEPVRRASAASQITPDPAPLDTSDPWLRFPVHIEPSPGESSMADLPEDELSRQRVFQNEAAAVLEGLLPKAFAPIRPVDLDVSLYQGGPDGPDYPITFSVRPKAAPGAAHADPPCTSVLEKHLRCREATLPNGITVRSVTASGDEKEGKTVTGTTLTFERRHSSVRLSVGGDDEAMVSAPVTTDQLLAVVQDAAFLELVDYADAHPMEPKEHAVRGG
ncbi:hypothetical protein SAMN05216483_2626 [Streptomyces sp. 2131.1]|uniref:hypothetical protein n=1 Tax=Streptomyces sp. 2131.1 TaxID=1855346 RepID=UPI00089D6ED2|nr:hypothetical protein [Streptomyces sp. 2131.1]SEC89589.1 hypothetical protein SAMN05216483_2626 [Streptomyces sp. 2131.1]